VLFRSNVATGYTVSGASSSPEHGIYHEAADVWVSGIFRVADLIGLDANAVVDLGRIVSGAWNSADGLLSIR
jgi:hypothetical protein